MPSLTQAKPPTAQPSGQSKYRHVNQKDNGQQNTNPRTTNDLSEKQCLASGKTSENVIDDYLRQYGLFRKPVAKDGSCLFRVVAEQVYNAQIKHLEIRHKCIQFMNVNRTLFEPFVEGSFEHHLFELKKTNVWAGQVEISALSLMYQRDFIVYQTNSHPQNVTGNGFQDKIYLCYSNGNHYDVVYPLKYQMNAAMVQSLLYDMLLSSVLPKLPIKESAAAQGSNEHVDDWTEVKPKQKGRSACEDLITYVLPDAVHNKEIFWQMKRSLDPTFYRNIELEVWKISQADQQKQDRSVAMLLQLKAGDKCLAYLKDFDDGKELHQVKINEISNDHKLYLVSTQGSNDQFQIPLENLRPETTDMSYKQLPGYYKKNNRENTGAQDKNGEVYRRKGKGARRQRYDGNKTRQGPSADAVVAESNTKKGENKNNAANTEVEDRKNAGKGGNSKTPVSKSPVGAPASENYVDDVKLGLVDSVEDISNTMVSNGVSSASETVSPVCEEPVKVAQSSESPAAFWGRMRGGANTTTTTPGNSKPTTPSSPPTQHNNANPKEEISMNESKQSATIPVNQRCVEVTNNKKKLAGDRTAKTKTGMVNNSNINNDHLKQKVEIDNKKKIASEEINMEHGQIKNYTIPVSNVKNADVHMKTSSSNIDTEILETEKISMSIEELDNFIPSSNEIETTIEITTCNKNDQNDTSNIYGAANNDNLPQDESQHSPKDSTPVMQTSEYEEQRKPSEECLNAEVKSDNDVSVVVKDDSLDSSCQSDEGMTALQISLLSSPPRELQVHLSDNANMRLVKMREKIITCGARYSAVDTAAKKNDSPTAPDSVHVRNDSHSSGQEEGDSLVLPLVPTYIDEDSISFDSSADETCVDTGGPNASSQHSASFDKRNGNSGMCMQSDPSRENSSPDDKPQKRAGFRKSVSFGSTTEIKSLHTNNEHNATQTPNNARSEYSEPVNEDGTVKSEPGKLILPIDLIEKCQGIPPNVAVPMTQDISGAAQAQVFSPSQCIQPSPMAGGHMFPFPQIVPAAAAYPLTFVSEPYNPNHDISKEADGKDLPLDDIATLRHFFNLGVIFHNNYVQYQQQQLQSLCVYPTAVGHQMMYQPFQSMVIPQAYGQHPSNVYLPAAGQENNLSAVHSHPSPVEAPEERPAMRGESRHVTMSPKSSYENRQWNPHNPHPGYQIYPAYSDVRSAAVSTRHQSGPLSGGLSHSSGAHPSGLGVAIHQRDETNRTQTTTRYHPPSNQTPHQFLYR